MLLNPINSILYKFDKWFTGQILGSVCRNDTADFSLAIGVNPYSRLNAVLWNGFCKNRCISIRNHFHYIMFVKIRECEFANAFNNRMFCYRFYSKRTLFGMSDKVTSYNICEDCVIFCVISRDRFKFCVNSKNWHKILLIVTKSRDQILVLCSICIIQV